MLTKTVFASGEAGSPDAAFVIAEKSLWEKIGRIEGAEVRHIQHAVTARVVPQIGLDIETWKTEEREVSAVIVTLLAAITINSEGSKND